MKNIKILIPALLFLFILSSCNKDNSSIDTPKAPNEESFVINFNDFANGKKTGATYVNKSAAVIYVSIWNTILSFNLAIPVAAFKATISQKVQLIDTNHWMWEANTTILNQKFTSQLHAFYVNDSIQWEMHISQEGGIQDFIWFTGMSDIQQNNGNWQIYKSPESPQAYLKVNWQKNSENTIASIKYENILENDDNKGAYIEYGKNTNSDFNRYYNIIGTEQGNYANIEWNFESKFGKIKAPKTFQNEDWHCWNENGIDSSCN